MREKNIEIICPQSKNERIPDTNNIKELQKNNSKKLQKSDTKTRHPQMISYEKSHCGHFGNFNPAQRLGFGRLPQIQVERIGVGG